MTRFDILTQKRYESDLTRPEFETQTNDIQLTPTFICCAIRTPVIRVSNFS